MLGGLFIVRNYQDYSSVNQRKKHFFNRTSTQTLRYSSSQFIVLREINTRKSSKKVKLKMFLFPVNIGSVTNLNIITRYLVSARHFTFLSFYTQFLFFYSLRFFQALLQFCFAPGQSALSIHYDDVIANGKIIFS